MTKTFAEILLFASVVVNAALLLFIAGVLRKIMNDMTEAEFKRFVDSLVRHSSRSPFMLTALNVPALGSIPYFYFYGFGSRWIAAGLALWLAAGLLAKALKVPIYRAIASLAEGDLASLAAKRQALNNGNILQAVLDVTASGLMAVAFMGAQAGRFP